MAVPVRPTSLTSPSPLAPSAPARMRPHRTHPAPVAPAAAEGGPDTWGPRVLDDMTVEVALSVMSGARVEYLLLCDGDDECTGSVTRAQLASHRDCPTYTDQVRLRDVLGGPLAPPDTLAC